MATSKPAKKRVDPKLISTVTLAVLLALTVFLSVIGLSGMKVSADGLYKLLPWLPGVNDDWKEALVPGNDLGGGTFVELTAAQGDMDATAFQNALMDAKDILYNRLSYKGYSSAQVRLTGNNTILVEMPEYAEEVALKELVSTKGYIAFTDASGNEIINSAHISAAQPSTQDGENYSVSVLTNDEGTKLLGDATTAMVAAGSGSMSLVLDGGTVTTATVNQAFTDGGVSVPIGTELQDAWSFAAFLNFGPLPLDMTETASGAMSEKTGEGAADALVLAGAVALLIVVVLLIVRYRLGGLLAAWALWVVTIFAFYCAAISGMPFSVSSALGLLCTLAVAAGGIMIVMENIGYNAARVPSVPQAMRTGFKRSNAAVLDVHAVLLLAAFALMSIGMGTVHAFSRVLCMGVCVSAVGVMILLRVLLYNAAAVLPGSCELYTGKKHSKEAQ